MVFLFTLRATTFDIYIAYLYIFTKNRDFSNIQFEVSVVRIRGYQINTSYQTIIKQNMTLKDIGAFANRLYKISVKIKHI